MTAYKVYNGNRSLTNISVLGIVPDDTGPLDPHLPDADSPSTPVYRIRRV